MYQCTSPQPHAPTRIEEDLAAESRPWPRVMSYDGSGNQTGWVYDGSQRRTTEWNEENRVTRVAQNGQELSRMLYDGDGERRVHFHHVSGEEETAYHDQHLTLRDGRFITKHIYAGQTRIASKMDPDWFRDPPTIYYHPDHLGSTSFASNGEQALTQRDEYFPTGELWGDASDSRYELRRAYVFTGKELDQATGLYYFGARYYDSRISTWLSPDPILDEYMEGGPGGGVFNPGNLGLYTYTLNNPVNLVDPDGRNPQGASRNFPPGMNGCRHPSCFNGPEGAAFHQRQMLQRAEASSSVATTAGAAGRASRGIGDVMRRVLAKAVMQSQQAAPLPPQPTVAPSQLPQPAKPPQATSPAKPAQAAPRGGAGNAGAQARGGAARQAVGAAREAKVAELTGGKVSNDRIEASDLGHTDIDVVAGNGDLVMVGGPKKGENLSNLARVIKLYQHAANSGERKVGVRAYFFLPILLKML
ncbi:RHS repeat domain-containing protein [Sorangium cellulosum]|uniref:RHS repeat domain-containing protein n=1 Tax=Sorangium cellulosum TaxID=56 RepID=UPI001331A8E7|nr:RHS repeat-associated core domain-containing protein [Sorangium cellulosum]